MSVSHSTFKISNWVRERNSMFHLSVQKQANVFCKRLESKYFKLCRPYGLSCNRKAAIDDM